jgi:hypothetical protein
LDLLVVGGLIDAMCPMVGRGGEPPHV